MVRGSPNPRYFGLPARLRRARKQSGLTRAALGSKVGRDSEVPGYVETGERVPTVGTVERLANGLGVSAAWLGFGLGDRLTEHGRSTCEGMGARLQLVRTERGHSKAALARLVQLSPSTVADIEGGAQTGIEVVESLAKALAISPAWLAFNEGPRELPKRRRAVGPAVASQST